MKFDKIPQEFKDKAEFACLVCMARYKAEHGGEKFNGCAARNIGKEYCCYVEQAVENEENKK